MAENHDSAGVAIHPPVLYVLALAAGCLGEVIWPLWTGLGNPPLWAFATGTVLVAAGGALLATAISRFLRAGTNVPTHLPSTAIVTDGPYRFSRNPIYIALTLVYSGLAFLLASPWAMLMLPVVIIVLSRGVIAREEAYLADKFPEQYKAYAARVRRWL